MKCVANINCIQSNEYIHQIELEEIEKRLSSVSSSSQSEINLINLEIFNVEDNDIDIFYSTLIKLKTSLYSSITPNDDNKNLTDYSEGSNNSASLSDIIKPKRSRGRPRKSPDIVQNSNNNICGSSTSSSGQKRVLEELNNEKGQNIISSSLLQESSVISFEDKRKHVYSQLSSSSYIIQFGNSKDNIYEFSANMNLMVLRIRQNIVSRLYKNIIRDLSLSFFISPSLIADTTDDIQSLYIHIFYSMFASRLPDNFKLRITPIVRYLKKTISSLSTLKDLVAVVKKEYPIESSIYELVINLSLTVNPTSIKSETCFSALKRIKDCYQASMKPSLLQAYMSSTCNYDLLSSLNSTEIVDKYIERLHLPVLSNTLSKKVLRNELLNCE
ncbi:hypothetical protein WA158_007051 [Blastocystis sp. Blastoise]